MVNGICDNLLLTTYLSAKCPVFIAPAMDLDMYKHQSTKSSFEKLASFGNIMIPATSGELASGLVGEGRMASEGQLTKSPVSNGDRVKFKDYAGNDVQIEGRAYSLVKMVDILSTSSKQ